MKPAGPKDEASAGHGIYYKLLHYAYFNMKYIPMPNTSDIQKEKYATTPQRNRRNLLPRIREPILLAMKQMIATTSTPIAIFIWVSFERSLAAVFDKRKNTPPVVASPTMNPINSRAKNPTAFAVASVSAA